MCMHAASRFESASKGVQADLGAFRLVASDWRDFIVPFTE
jgi:hypothetical protein